MPLLLRLSAPGVLLVAFQSLVSISDSYFVGRLGTTPLAGLALVFPLVMLLQMTSSGAMGGGVSSAIARALGSGNAAAARRLAVHALALGLAMGALFTLLMLPLGRAAYSLLGGRDESLVQALAYSDILFAGAILVWLANTLANLLRGTGNMLVPALALVGAALLQVPLCGSLVLGLGPMPRLGIAGAAVAYVAAFGAAGCAMALVVLRPS
ncbi:MAG TPA: MATE family efflux transporter, partial [Burkholderiales bacterium]|nr:MATE family efflux transporter [Burkholderiales bacterium]